jgi:hypothetical protein
MIVLATVICLTSCGSSKDATESRKSAATILADAAAALKSVQSYRIDGMLDPGFTVHIVVVRGGSTGTVTAKGITWSTVASHGKLWLQGRGLWQKTLSPAEAARLGDSWVLVTDPNAAFRYARALRNLDETIPGIVFGPHPTLVNKGAIVVDGARVVRLESDDDIYDILATGTPFPTSWLEKENPGPDGKPCGITLSGYDAPAVVRPPAAAKTLTGTVS